MEGFQGIIYVYATLAMIVLIINTMRFDQFSQIILGVVILLGMLKLALLVPAGIPERQIRRDSEFSKLARLITDKNDRILAWPLAHYEYLLSDRQPASGDFDYLPWQKDYYQNPQFGIQIDSCSILEKVMPKLIYFMPASYNGWTWEQYGLKCFDQLLQKWY